MITLPLHASTSHHLFFSHDDTEVVPNNLHPLWNLLSQEERTNLECMANELICLHEMEWVNPPHNQSPWRSAFEEAVNEAVWAALPVMSLECVTGSIKQVFERGGVPVDALSFLTKHEHVSLKCRLTGTAIAAFRHGESVEESVHSELFGWLEEYTGCLGDNLAELIEVARTGLKPKRKYIPSVWREEGF